MRCIFAKEEKVERNLVFIALFAALIAALGLIPKIDLAFGVPITAQSLGIMLAGTVLGAKRGLLAVLLFSSDLSPCHQMGVDLRRLQVKLSDTL